MEDVNEVNDFRESEVGDKVYCLRKGEGVITSLNKLMPYPVTVKFGTTSTDNYTITGKNYAEHKHPVLYRTQPTVTAPKPKKKTKIKKYIVFYSTPSGSSPEIMTTMLDKEEDYTYFISRTYLKILATEIIEKEF